MNGVSGTLTLTGRTLTTASTFTNNGSITLAADYPALSAVAGVLDIPTGGTLTNFVGNTLTGGTFYIGDSCIVRFPGADVVTNATHLTIEGTGKIVNKTNAIQPNGLLNLAANAASGSFSIVSATFPVANSFNNAGSLALYGATLQIGGNLTNSGQVSVFAFSGDTDSLVTVAGLTNFSGTTLTGGSFLLDAEAGVSATLKFPGANIVTNAASITLVGAGAGILNANDNSNALANLSGNSASGALSISEGRNIAVSGAFNNAGVLSIGAASNFTVQAGNSFSQSAGLTTLTGGSLAASSVSLLGGQVQGSGSIIGNVTASAFTLASSIRGLAPGAGNGQYDQILVTGTAALAGTLSVSLASGLASTLLPSNTFSILTTSGSLTGSFSNAQNGSRITTADHAGSFLVSITGNSVVLSDFYPTLGLTAWKTTPGMFSAAELADPNFTTADPENDGLKNIMEYGFSRQPQTPDSAGAVQGGIVTADGGSYLGLTFTRFKGASDIAFQVEVSSDLQTWNSGSPFTALQNRVDQGATELITWRDTTAIAGVAKRFIRLNLMGP